MKLYDSLTGDKKDVASTTDEIKMYVCGPNLYGPCHVGHALSFVVFDVLRRYLEYKGWKVLHVQNFTDIEDRIIDVANQEGTTINDLAEHYIDRFLEEMDAMGVQRAHHYPRATENISKMIEIVEMLISKDKAYAVDGDVYFRVRDFSSYGKLSKRSLDEMMAGTRVETDHRKNDPMDFALWKSAKNDEPAWPSPWGLGRPGWHIECTAMSMSILGEQFDIHGGGQDVMFPHHENEIAQSESYTGISPVVNFWVHNGLLRQEEESGEKMTRHQGNFVSCSDALARYHPDAIRLFLLSSHYRNPRVYSEKEIAAHQRAAEHMVNVLERDANKDGESLGVEKYKTKFDAAMDNDLNTPQALAVLFELVHDINRGFGEGLDVIAAQRLLRELGGVLGLTFKPISGIVGTGAEPFINLLVELRTQLRDMKQFDLADSIRARLTDSGVALEDTANGTLWKFRQSDELS